MPAARTKKNNSATQEFHFRTIGLSVRLVMQCFPIDVKGQLIFYIKSKGLFQTSISSLHGPLLIQITCNLYKQFLIYINAHTFKKLESHARDLNPRFFDKKQSSKPFIVVKRVRKRNSNTQFNISFSTPWL